jgi:L-lactate dehydrogenase (cytochrome)
MKLNKDDYQHLAFRKRVLKDVSTIDTSTEVFGQKLRQPVILAPVGFAGVYAKRGEVQAARAAEKAGIPFSLSSVSICSMDEVKKSTSIPFWYQFYMLKEKNLALDLLNRARDAGCPVLLLTIDLPAVGARHRYNRSSTLSGYYDTLAHLGWYIDVRLRGQPLVLGDIASLVPHLRDLPSMRKWMSAQLNSTMTWKDLEWVRANWPGKIVLKGIMDTEDAYLAAETGMDGLVVSNHGARHLDCTPSTISVLPDIVKAVGDRLDILIDGGIYSSLDVVKTLALGAKACMIGRAWAFALAARGETGVSEVLSIFQSELTGIMAQLGVKCIKEIDSTILHSSS